MLISPLQNNFYKYNPQMPLKRNRLAFNGTSETPVKTYQAVSFKGFNPVKSLKDYIQYKKALKFSDELFKYIKQEWGMDNFIFRLVNLEALEGIQYNIKAFKDMTMKEIQYLSENLHVIAVKRGCKNMCGHCYADARPSKREMSYEDFHTITDGFKKLRKRLHNIDIYGENHPIVKDEIIYRTTELFYDADCIDILIKDKKGKEYDFIKLSEELFDSLGRKTVFDTSGWHSKNIRLQERAEKYAEHFLKPENMEKLNQFNVSFNLFNATYISSRKALKNGDLDKAKRLRDRFVDDMANTIFTFTPIINSPKFNILNRALNPSIKNSDGFNAYDMLEIIGDVIKKLEEMYLKDFYGSQKYIKTEDDYQKYLKIIISKMQSIDTALNSSGRMMEFLKEHKIASGSFQDHSETTKKLIKSLQQSARMSKIVMHKLIDADGKVYHMDYARFVPTELQLNIPGKNQPSPKLANLLENFTITRENLKR